MISPIYNSSTLSLINLVDRQDIVRQYKERDTKTTTTDTLVLGGKLPLYNVLVAVYRTITGLIDVIVGIAISIFFDPQKGNQIATVGFSNMGRAVVEASPFLLVPLLPGHLFLPGLIALHIVAIFVLTKYDNANTYPSKEVISNLHRKYQALFFLDNKIVYGHTPPHSISLYRHEWEAQLRQHGTRIVLSEGSRSLSHPRLTN